MQLSLHSHMWFSSWCSVISNNREPLQVPAKQFPTSLDVVAWLTEESAEKLARMCGSSLAVRSCASLRPRGMRV
jgi:hypothetical protein